MLHNYLTFALRSLIRNRGYSLINIGGLIIALSCFTAILLFVEFEFSFDRYHNRPQDIYRVVKDFVNDDGVTIPDATTPPALAVAMRTELPEVQKVTRFVPNRSRLFLLEAGEKHFYETRLFTVDGEFFNVFDFQFVRGARETAFNEIHSTVITESAARKYFGDADPIDKIIRMNTNGGTDYVVTGVIEDVPQNSHFIFDMVIPFEGRRAATMDQDWDFYGFQTYARLDEGFDGKKFESNVRELFARHQPTSTNVYHVQALTDIHLTSDLRGELSVNGNIFNVRIMMAIGLFVILIAAINYINLVTAQSAKRAREIGIRKVSGAHRGQLVRQLLTETVLTVSIALALSIVLTTAVLPLTQSFVGSDLYAFIGDSQWIWALPAVALLVAMLAGLYPAFALSSFEPIKVLRGSLLVSRRGWEGFQLRQGLVLFQFIISTGLIVGSLTVIRQLNFMKEKKLGFNQESIIMLPNIRNGIGSSADPKIMLDEMETIYGVSSIARADGVFGGANSLNGVSAKGIGKTHIAVNFLRADYEFVPALQINLKEGRNFSKDFASDSAAIILNETAVATLGLTPPYIGQSIVWDDGPGKTHDLTLIGIVEDFHFNSFREGIKPFGFTLEVGNGSTFFLKIHAASMERTIADVGAVWARHYPERPFTYTFQDETFAKLYLYETRFQKLFAILTALAIAITCLGLFGLITYIAESRTKEIGIRKVLGASVQGIVVLLSRNFLLMALIALMVSFPVAYYLMTKWLAGFVYRIDVDWKVFVMSGVVAVVITLLTVGAQSIKAALTNPVDSLKRE